MRTRAPLAIGCAAALVGTAAALFHAHAGLTISHFDARAHLVVSRRILDSLTPGWQQIGAVWLPLPHLLNMVPVQIDAWYRSGASAVAISIASTGVGAWALARIILASTGSVAGGLTGAALLLANPNWLYIQSTPMTEPLLLATTLLAITLIADWIERGAEGWPQAAGLALTATCMTRYEGWLIASAAIALTAGVLIRRGTSVSGAIRAALKLSVYPAIAIAIFSANSRWTIGTWFIPRDFFVPENDALGQPSLAWQQVRESALQLSGTATIRAGYAGATLATIAFVRSRQRASLILLIALFACVLLPWYAYLQGHPLRVRYGLLLVAGCAALAGAGVGLLWRPLRLAAAAVIVAAALSQMSPLSRDALLIVESQRDAQNAAGRVAVTKYLVEHFNPDGRDGPIMMSMGSLAHYMHDLGRAGFDIHSFLHEGNGQAWQYAVLGPKGYVKWVAIEERAEGGDALYQAWQRDNRYLDGFDRVAEGGGVALYRRRSTSNTQLPTPKPSE
jgi:hypothetical protein